jgi:NADH:ubiquinone oxidoreductase subunit E
MTQDFAVEGGDQAAPARSNAILVAHELWLAGETSAEAHAEAARALGISPAELVSIREFHQAILSRPAGEPLILCRGVSCRVHGAEELHATLKPLLEAAGVLGTTLDVHCLSQCEHGPNMKVGDRVLCTGRRCVVTDNRPWRPVGAGPKPVGSAVPTSGS